MVQPASKRLITEDVFDAALDAEAALARNADNLTSGTVADARIAATIARDSEVTAAVLAEANLARNADNLTSGTVADARIAATITRDSELAAEAALARDADNLSSGTVADARIPATITRDTELAAEAALARNADNLSSGTVPVARIPATIARVDSPALTGTPTAPTPTAGDNDTSIATTAFVQTALGGAAAFQHVAKGSNQTYSVNTFVDDTALQFPVAASGIYIVEGLFYFTGDFADFTFVLPSGTMDGVLNVIEGTPFYMKGPGWLAPGSASVSGFTGSTAAISTGSGIGFPINIRSRLALGPTGGTAKCQFKRATGGTNLVVLAGSHLTVHKVG